MTFISYAGVRLPHGRSCSVEPSTADADQSSRDVVQLQQAMDLVCIFMYQASFSESISLGESSASWNDVLYRTWPSGSHGSIHALTCAL